jgi:hypothetical protein
VAERDNVRLERKKIWNQNHGIKIEEAQEEKESKILAEARKSMCRPSEVAARNLWPRWRRFTP